MKQSHQEAVDQLITSRSNFLTPNGTNGTNTL